MCGSWGNAGRRLLGNGKDVARRARRELGVSELHVVPVDATNQ